MKKRRFKHLSWTDRLKIETMLKDKRHKQEIADEIGVHLKTIYNEIKRGRYIHTNSDLTEEERYSPEMAEAAYREHLAAKGPDLKIGNDHELAQHIEKKIAEDGYSPAAVLGEIKEQGLEFKTSICESTLYSYIDKGVFLTVTNKNLPVKGQKKRPYNKVKRAKRPPAGTSIENRPKEIDDRAVVGDWEMDCVEGKKKTKKTLLVLTKESPDGKSFVLCATRPPEAWSASWIALNVNTAQISAKSFERSLSITVPNSLTVPEWKSPVAAKATGQRYTIVTPIRHTKEDQTKM